VNYEEELLDSVEPVEEPPQESLCPSTLLFVFKGSFHIFCISVFETTFYFLYVNRSEDAGIFNTINTYYSPLVNGCEKTWTNATKWFVKELFAYSINKTVIDAQGLAAYTTRTEYNTRLILQSSIYSLVSLSVCVAIICVCLYNTWKVHWIAIFLENMLFISVLAGYEFFFYNTIIYNYMTLSTAELNKYITDGLASCAMPPQ
jgi:hypothetical protein